jgi:hypothetical protein
MKHLKITLAVLTTLTMTAHAQQQNSNPQGGNLRNKRVGQNDPRKAPERKFAPAAEQMMESMRRMRDNDPAKTVTPMLLKRNDVRGELGLDPKQREAIDEAKKKSDKDNETKLSSNEFFVAIQQRMADIANLPPAEQEAARKEAIESLKEQGQKLADTMRGAQEMSAEAVEKVLRPQQIERLRQLDWQWRGPLALADPKMNEIFQLSMEQQGAIGQMVQDFREQQREIMGKALGQAPKAATAKITGNGEETLVVGSIDEPKIEEQNQKGDGTGQITLKDGGKGKLLPPKSETEIQNRYDVAKREVDTLRKKYGEAVLKTLSPEQRQYWFQSLGRQFAFRAND